MICKNCGYILDKKDDVCQGCGFPAPMKHVVKAVLAEEAHVLGKKKVVHK